MLARLLGQVVFRAEGPFPERFLNACRKENVPLQRVRRLPEGLSAEIPAGHFKALRLPAYRSRMRVRVAQKRGAGFVRHRYRKRWGLALGTLLTLGILWVSSLFIWNIEITGCLQVDAQEVKQLLEKHGFHEGVFTPKMDVLRIRDAVLLEMPELIWMAINISGSYAEVQVRESVPKPEIVPEDCPQNLIAAADGTVLSATVKNGNAAVKAGDTVTKGQLLVSGVLDSKEEGLRLVRSEGQIMARIYDRFTLRCPSVMEEKSFSGRKTTHTTLNFFQFSVNLFKNGSISYSDYDTIKTVKRLSLFGVPLPISYVSVCYEETLFTTRPATEDEQRLLCEKAVADYIAAQYGAAEVLSLQTEMIPQEDGMSVQGELQAVTDIARAVPILSSRE